MYRMIQPNIRDGMSRFSPIRPRKQQADGFAIRSKLADFLHNVRGRQQPLRMGDVAAAAKRRLQVGKRRRMP